MGKPKSSSSLNPWEALFASVTRPQAVVASTTHSANDDGDGDSKSKPKSSKTSSVAGTPSSSGGYTILIQHSLTPKSQRQWALSSTMAVTTDRPHSNKGSTSLQTSMSSMTLKSTPKHTFQGSWYGISGPFLVRQAFEELCQQCDGAVVFVSVTGTSGVLDIDELDGSNFNDGNYNEVSTDDGEYAGQVDIKNVRPQRKRRNAVQMFQRNGACVDLSIDPYGWEDDTEDNGCNSPGQCSTMNKLQPIALAIRRAALKVETRRTSFQGQKQKKGEQQMQRPIPIVFETLTPLLHLHGAEKIRLLLKTLGIPSPSSVTSGMHPILSPIIAPILYESLRPSEHRCLEDMADAMVHLNLTDAPGSSSDSTSNDLNSKVITSGIMDLVRRGGGGRSGLGGKLIRHCVPFHVMRATISTDTYLVDSRDVCYWVLDHDKSDNTEGIDDGQQGNSQPIQNADQPTPSTTGPSRPRIYLQDDDPEFDDFDEEDDLDDDLDL